MRVCVIGGGLAGSLLAWRLLATRPEYEVHLVAGDANAADATAASGGLVRGFEFNQSSSQMAVESLSELRSSRTLRAWSAFRETGSVYVCAEPLSADVRARVDYVNARLEDSARIIDGIELAHVHGIGGVPLSCAVVHERYAGHINPARLRKAVQKDLTARGGTLLALPASRIQPLSDGSVSCRLGGQERCYDAAVVAAGPWTARLLAHSGLPAAPYRTKLIQYGLFKAAGRRPPAFVDDISGLYGRAAGDDQVLLGIPTESWNADPDSTGAVRELNQTTEELAAVRLPELRLSRLRVVASVDTYTDPPGLALRPVLDEAYRLFTFTGGSGGAAKTALAASRIAADRLIGSVDMYSYRPEEGVSRPLEQA